MDEAKDRLVSGSLPLYSRPVPLSADRHADKAILPSSSPFSFAARTPTLPLTVDEFERAMLDYPIVFYGPRRRAVAVVGLASDRNAFISPDGSYAPGCYIPAHLRRFPFVLARVEGGDGAVLCIEEDAACIVDCGTEGALPLFEGGAPAASVRDTMELCQVCDDAERRTIAFAAMLDEFDLFEPRQAHFRPSDQTEDQELLLDYVGVSRQRMAELGPDKLAALRDAGALGAIYAHLFSQANWDVLPFRTRKA